MTLSFLLTSLIVVASPGTGVLYTLAVALTSGARPSVAAAFGCTLGIVPHMLAAITGLAARLHASAVAFEAVRYAGVASLLWMAWATLRERGALRLDADADDRVARSDREVALSPVLANLLNPKLSIFFVAFLPQFVGADHEAGAALVRMLGLSAVFMAMTLAVFVAYGVSAASVRDRVLERPRVLA
jgi:threonine/homoserine/homoserine lactone efflux protein